VAHEIIPPFPLQRAQERGLCFYGHETISMTVSPVTIYASLAPPATVYCWRLFCLVFGELSPAGISENFIVRHRGPSTIIHEDPWIHSVVDFPYPLTETLTYRNPHEFWIVNNTGVDQTFDITLHFMEFTTEEDWMKYKELVDAGRKMIQFLGGAVEAIKKTNEILNTILSAIRVIQERVSQERK